MKKTARNIKKRKQPTHFCFLTYLLLFSLEKLFIGRHQAKVRGPCLSNKLKSLKVAQLKDEMDGDEDDGCHGVCDVAV